MQAAIQNSYLQIMPSLESLKEKMGHGWSLDELVELLHGGLGSKTRRKMVEMGVELCNCDGFKSPVSEAAL